MQVRLRPLSLLRISGVVVTGTLLAVDCRTVLSLPEDPAAPELSSVRGVGAASHRFSVMPSHVCTLLSLLADNDVELCGFTVAHTPLALVLVVPGDRCLVDKYVLAGVVGIDKAVT